MAVKSKLNVNTVQGDKVILNFQVFDEDDNPLILTGKEILWSARNSITKAMVLSKSTAAGITILDPPDDNQFNVQLESSETSNLVGAHDHEAVLKDGSDKVSITNSDNSFGILTFREKVT